MKAIQTDLNDGTKNFIGMVNIFKEELLKSVGIEAKMMETKGMIDKIEQTFNSHLLKIKK
jgi:hypothetical protein